MSKQNPQRKLQASLRQWPDIEQSIRVLFRFFRTSNLAAARNTTWMDAFGLTAEQCSVLTTLSRPQSKDGMTVNELCNYLMISRQGLNSVLRRLELMGLTRRAVETQDRRVRCIQLTAKGWACVERIMPSLAAFSAIALRDFSAEDLRQLLQLTNRIRANLLKPSSEDEPKET
jgi:DNA-binding MarR family transcriptional regulator